MCPLRRASSTARCCLPRFLKATCIWRAVPFRKIRAPCFPAFKRSAFRCGGKRTGVTVKGCGGQFPEKNASLNVMSAGTAARFLPVVLAFAGGDYRFESSDQMKRRPMDVLFELERLGVTIEYAEERGHFPFRLVSEGISSDEAVIDTDKSTQFASGLLIAATIHPPPLHPFAHGRTHAEQLFEDDGSNAPLLWRCLRAGRRPHHRFCAQSFARPICGRARSFGGVLSLCPFLSSFPCASSCAG